jgi:predicted phosphohydrolase
MKTRIYSDIHLDHYQEHQLWYPPEMPDDLNTTLILAGDLSVGSKFIETKNNDKKFSWIEQISKKFKQIIIVLGNHDYWPQGGLTIINAKTKLDKMLQEKNITNVKILDCNTHEEDDFIIVGCTLWTDIKKQDHLLMQSISSYMSQDGKIAYKTGDHAFWERFTPQKWVSTHFQHKEFIRNIAQKNKDKKIFVVTHHAPLDNLISPQFAGHPANAYYTSDLSEIILDNPNIVAWAFGHVHHKFDLQFENCRIINHSIGYPQELIHEEDNTINPDEIITIGEKSKNDFFSTLNTKRKNNI